jgi:glycosyltransferase involved in cell wall biosynthesis
VSSDAAISIVVPTRDRPAALRGCLAALARQSAPGLDVVVVDDGSRERATVDAAVADLAGARVVRSPGRGPATARNLGARAASGDVICLLDDDCEPEHEWAERLAAAVRRAPGGIAGGRTVAPPGARPAVRASQAITNHLLAESLAHEGALGFAPSCNMAASREVLERLPFDSSYPSAAGEDREWWAQALADGLVAVYEPGAVVVHRQRLDPRGFLRQQFRYGRGAARFRRAGTGRSLARPRFYAALARRGFADGSAVGGLVLAAQLATAAGIAAERLRAADA